MFRKAIRTKRDGPANVPIGLLNERESALFARMAACDQRSCLAAWTDCQERFPDDLDRQRAALLGLVGKGLPTWVQELLAGAAARFAPERLASWGRRADSSYLAQVGRLAHHRAAAVKFLELAGSNRRVIELVSGRMDDDGRADRR